ncbi:MAG: hypothetical protein JOS17DRAFT_232489 [Linnemannia elongata]|nr:MAG: hypothetical protein JOS17DRAFT_232489 [Linnemannia elongata]
MSSAPSSPSNVQCMYLGIGQTSKTTSEAKDRGPLVCLSFFFFSLCLVTTFLSLDSFFFFLSLVSFLTLFCLVSRLLFSSLLSLLFSSLLLLSFFSPPSLLPSFPSLPSLFLTTPPLYLYRFFFSPHPTFSTFTPLPDSTPLPHLQQKLHRLLHHKNNSFYSCLSLGPLLLSSSPSACIHSPSHSFTHTHAQHYQTTTMKDDTLSFKEKYLRLRERFDRVSTTQRQYTNDLQAARVKTRKLREENKAFFFPISIYECFCFVISQYVHSRMQADACYTLLCFIFNSHLLDLLSEIQQMTGSGPSSDSDTSMEDLSDLDDDEDEEMNEEGLSGDKHHHHINHHSHHRGRTYRKTTDSTRKEQRLISLYTLSFCCIYRNGLIVVDRVLSFLSRPTLTAP